MDARNLLSLAGVLLTLGGAGYYWGLGRPADTTPAATTAREEAFVVSGIRARETGEDGQLLRTLTAPRLVQYHAPDEALLTRPELTLHAGGHPAWEIRAGQGRSLDLQREIWLEQGVSAVRRAPGATPLRFTTPRLVAWPAEERLLADQGVQFESTQGTLTSQRLDARFAVGTLQLDDNVSARYAPAPRQ